VGAEVDAQGAEVVGTGLLRRTTEDIRPPGDLEPHKTGGHDRRLKLCFQQSTGNSTGPQVYVAFGALRHGFLHQDVTDLEAAVGLEHTGHLEKATWLYLGYVEQDRIQNRGRQEPKERSVAEGLQPPMMHRHVAIELRGYHHRGASDWLEPDRHRRWVSAVARRR
jgi:hypothetical protein